MKSSLTIDPLTHPFCYSGMEYALEVLTGVIPSCIYVKGACERFFRDIEKNYFILDLDRAERYLRVVQRFRHVKGRDWKSENIHYEPWQNFCFMNIMGWIDPRTGLRRFRVAHIEVPRGSGKSLLASQAVLYFLALDNPMGNEISCVSTKKESARIVLDSAMAMANKSNQYLKKTGVKVLAHKIIHKFSNSYARALSSDSKSLDGLNDILAVMDELHAISRKLFDVIYSGMKKRRDSLMLCITTAGFNQDGVGYSQSQYAKKIALGQAEDDQMFAIIYTIDKGDNIYDPITWRKANPNFGVSVDPLAFESAALKCKEVPADLPNFKVKNLNIWLSEADAYFSMDKWDECADPNLREEDYRGKTCYDSIDLSNKIDLSAKVKVFYDETDGKYAIFQKAFIPEDTFKESESDLYQKVLDTELFLTPGGAIDYSMIEEEIKQDNINHKIDSCFFDPWNATQISQNLTKEMINMVEYPQRTSTMSEPMKSLEALIRTKKIKHNGGPLLRFCMANVVAKKDGNENVFPTKNSDRLKIDLAVALIMSMGGWLVREKTTESVYESRGVRSL
jgi:phage terminase large subunit-like protein